MIEQKHCMHEVTETHKACCHCGQAEFGTYVRVETPDTSWHGLFDPDGYTKIDWSEIGPCIPWSWRASGEEPCSNCDDTGTVYYMIEGDHGPDYPGSHKCGCREFLAHPFQENGSLDKCRRCQLPADHGMHS